MASPQNSATYWCERTTSAPAKPTGVTALVNPTEEEGNTWGENGILISWDTPDESDFVDGYSIFRGVLVAGISPASTEVTLQGTIWNVNTSDSDNGTWSTLLPAPRDIMDPEEYLEVGVTYVYRAMATRYDNCGDFQDSERSDPVVATYEAPDEEQDEGETGEGEDDEGDTDDGGDQVGGL